MPKLPSGRVTLGFDKASVQMAPVEKHTVYRIWRQEVSRDWNGNVVRKLVYVGATLNPRTRLLAHLRDGKPGDVVTLDFYSSVRAMAAAEKLAHETESPEIPCAPHQRHGTWRTRKGAEPTKVVLDEVRCTCRGAGWEIDTRGCPLHDS